MCCSRECGGDEKKGQKGVALVHGLVSPSPNSIRRSPQRPMLKVTLKAKVNTVGGLLASRRGFCWLPLLFFLFLCDKFRLKHLLKHANKKKLARIAAVYQ